MTPYIRSARVARQRLSGQVTGQAPSVNWLFPTPWFLDDLAAQEMALEAALGFGQARAIQAGTRAPDRAGQASRPSAGAPRATPFVPRLETRALGAAELIAEIATRTHATRQTDHSISRMSPTMTALTAVAPTTFRNKSRPRTKAQIEAQVAAARAAAQPVQEAPSAASQTAAATAVSTPSQIAPATASVRAAELLADVVREQSYDRTQPAASPPVAMPSSLEALARATRIQGTLAKPILSLRPMRPVTALAAAEALADTSAAASPTQRQAPITQITPDASPAATLEPPAMEFHFAVPELARPFHRAPARPTPRRAIDAASSRTPAALRQLAWTDHWLGRFAGASAPVLESLSAATAVNPPPLPTLTTRELAAMPFRAIFPELAVPAEVIAAARSRAQATPRASGSATPAQAQPTATRQTSFDAPATAEIARPTIPSATSGAVAPPARPAQTDAPVDNEPVSDEVFAAIAAGLTRGRSAGRPQTGPVRIDSANTPFQIAEEVLTSVTPWRGSGLAAALGSSPAMPALSATLSVGAAPTFDVRALTFASHAEAVRQMLVQRSGSLGAAGSVGLSAQSAGRPRPIVLTDLTTLARSAPSQVFFAGDELPRDVVSDDVIPGRAGMTADVAAAVAASQSAGESIPTRAFAPQTRGPATPATPVTLRQQASQATSERALVVRRSPAIGAVANLASRFGAERTEMVSDLSLDFVEPEILAAADVYGFDHNQAAQAQRLAHQSDVRLSALGDSVALTFVSAVGSAADAAQSHRRAAVLGGLGGLGGLAPSPASAPAQSVAFAAESGAPFAPAPTALESAAHTLPEPMVIDSARAKGATLWPKAALSALKVDRRRAAEWAPKIDFALELLAAGELADAATAASVLDDLQSLATTAQAPVSAEVASSASAGAGADSFAMPMPMPMYDASGQMSLFPSESSTPSFDASSARADGGLRAAFEAIYVALTADPAAQNMAPSERAARALAVARRSSAGESLSAKARAALAWSVLPTVVTGGLEAELAAQIDARLDASRAGAQTFDRPSRTFAGEMTSVAAERSRPAAREHYDAPSATPALVRTGPTADALREAANAAMSGTRTAAGSIPTAEAMAKAEGIPEWFAEAARHIAAESASSSSSGITLAEMTLVSAAPKASLAASPREASGASSHSIEGQSTEGAQSGQGKSPDLETMVDELASMLRDYFDVQRMRNGDY